MRSLVFIGLGLAVGCGGTAFTSSDGNGAAGGHAAGGVSSAGSSGSAGSVITAGGAGGSVASGGQTDSSGSDSGGSAGTGNQAGSSGSGGSGPTCAQLFTRASKELEAATVCNPAANVQQCTGKVTEPCGCERPVESKDSLETKAYLATLEQIHQKKCAQACPAIACLVADHAQCSVMTGSAVAHCAPLYPPTP